MMSAFNSSILIDVFRTSGKLLTFQLSKEEYEQLGLRHLVFGLACTLVVGIGRWWDDPGANLLQHLGLGSVIYIFVLTGILLFIAAPLNPENWTYKPVLTFVSLTSPPALLYAIPVERFADLSIARSLNVWFLAIVATWRLALLLFYFKQAAGLSIFASIVVTLLPVIAIVTTLTALNLERAVFDIMGGLRESGTSNDEAYGVLFGLTFFSMLLLVPTFICYLGLIFFRRDR
ncbi:MAG: hypothetical protein IPL32_07110 [Chloracidobacterium sp.]|nr:hypothetical protein [Chloracidobacterium sp.]